MIATTVTWLYQKREVKVESSDGEKSFKKKNFLLSFLNLKRSLKYSRFVIILDFSFAKLLEALVGNTICQKTTP